MKNWSTKKKIGIIMLSALFVAFFSLILFVSYIFTDGFKDYQKYCSSYIPSLRSYYSENGKYPDNINNFIEPKNVFKRYENTDCGYLVKDDEFMFYFSSGLGVTMYFSKTDTWVDD